MMLRLVAAAATSVILLSACTSEDEDLSRSEPATSERPPSEQPNPAEDLPCDEVWVPDATLPTDYAGCVGGEPITGTCEDGDPFYGVVLDGRRLLATPGDPVFDQTAAEAGDPTASALYQRTYASCF